MDTIQIRAANSNDITLVTGIIRGSFKDIAKRFKLTPENCPKHPSNCTEEWIENDFAKGVRYFILEKNDVPVGCVALENPNPELCYLERLAVLPSERQKGLGTILVNHVIEQAKALGAKVINIGIINEHHELKSWYRRIGFIEGEQKEFSHLPFIVVFMSYNL